MSLFSNNNFYIESYFWESILNAIFIIVLLVISFVLLRTIQKYHFFKELAKKNKAIKYSFEFISGVITSLISIWYIYNPNWTFSFFIFGILSIAFFMNIYFAIGSMPLVLTTSILNFFHNRNEGVMDSYYYLILNCIILFLGLIFSFFAIYIKWKNNLVFLFILGNYIFVGFVTTFPILVLNVIANVESFLILKYGINFIFYIIICLFLYSVIKSINKFIEKTEMISQNVLFNKGFIIEKFAMKSIKDFVKKNKVNRAIIIRFDIRGLEQVISNKGYSYGSEIKRTIILDISNKLSKLDSILYMQQDNSEYFALIKIDNNEELNIKEMYNGNKIKHRNQNDYLLFYENLLNDTIKEFKYLSPRLKIFAYCGFYGIDNNNISEINNELSKINIANFGIYLNNVIMIRNTQNLTFNKISKNMILKNLNLFSPNDIHISFNQIKKNNNNLFYVNASNLKPFVSSKEELWHLANDELISSTIMCHISAKGIKEFVSQKYNKEKSNIIIIDYPQYLLEQIDFSVYELLSRINSYGIDNNQYFLNIRITKKSFSQNFVRNVNLLKDNDINIMFDGLSKDLAKVDLATLKQFKPIAIKYA